LLVSLSPFGGLEVYSLARSELHMTFFPNIACISRELADAPVENVYALAAVPYESNI